MLSVSTTMRAPSSVPISVTRRRRLLQENLQWLPTLHLLC